MAVRFWTIHYEKMNANLSGLWYFINYFKNVL